MTLFDLPATLRTLRQHRPGQVRDIIAASGWDGLPHPEAPQWRDASQLTQVLALGVAYYTRRNPCADAAQIGIAATITAGQSTGLWGGWGLDEDPRFVQAQEFLTAFAGGIPAIPDAAFDVPGGQPAFTLAGIDVLERHVFRGRDAALHAAYEYLYQRRHTPQAARAWRALEAYAGPPRSHRRLLHTSAEISAMLGITQRRVRQIAAALGIGRRAGIYTYTPEDVRAIREKWMTPEKRGPKPKRRAS